MIISVKELQTIPEFKNEPEESLKHRLDAIEQLIRAYTNNNFQNRFIRFQAASQGGVLLGTSPFMKVGDTVQITESGVNDGLYVITEIEDSTKVDKQLFDFPCNLITKVQYPKDVIFGAINLMKWELEGREKVGVKSETLSRHTISYVDLDGSNSIMGYPAGLIGFLKPYMKARF